MNANIKEIVKVDTLDLQEQFRLCEQWNDPDQWDHLGVLYYQRGYDLNARHCFKRADALRVPVFVEVE
jgi:hypothetical protein